MLRSRVLFGIFATFAATGGCEGCCCVLCGGRSGSSDGCAAVGDDEACFLDCPTGATGAGGTTGAGGAPTCSTPCGSTCCVSGEQCLAETCDPAFDEFPLRLVGIAHFAQDDRDHGRA